jgi:hypothetical protein
MTVQFTRQGHLLTFLPGKQTWKRRDEFHATSIPEEKNEMTVVL